jgi:hypothetical protein
MNENLSCGSGWLGFPPPQRLFSGRRFLGVALDPPNELPGSWIGAGKAMFLEEDRRFLLTARPRKVEGDVRGFAAQVFTSEDGVEFNFLSEVTAKKVQETSGIPIHSIEGTQLLRNPATGLWHFFLSCDTGDTFVWGGVQWETVLLTSSNLNGPWKSEGKVLPNGDGFDACQARDSSIDIVDGLWICLYKAKDTNRQERPALATSLDGMEWTKHGPLTVDGEDRIAFLSGSFFPCSQGPMFLGIETQLADSRQRKADVVYADEHGIGHGGGSTPHFVAYLLHRREADLETIYRAPWQPGSEFEHSEHPLLGYSSLAYDPSEDRILAYLEAIDPRKSRAIGLNETVERTVVYEMRD